MGRSDGAWCGAEWWTGAAGRQRRDGARKRRRQTVEEAQGREQWWRAGLCWLVLAVRRADQHQRCGSMSLPQ
jgi:hypothetical protein